MTIAPSTAGTAERLTELLRSVVAGFDLEAPHVVAGEQRAPGASAGWQQLADPATGAATYTYPTAPRELVDEAVTSAVEAQLAWRSMAPHERGLCLERFADALVAHADALAEAESRTVGKPIRETRVEVQLTARSIRYFGGWTDKLAGTVPPAPPGVVNLIQRVPLGVLGLLTPWNAPIVTAGTNLGPMLAAGNAVVVKPSEFTPATTAVMALLAVRAGMPEGLVNVVAGPGAPTGQALVDHPGVAKLTFIGSRETGNRVAAAAAARGASAVLELGGKSAQIVFPDADLDRAIPATIGGIFGSAGQSCTAGSRVLIHEDVFDAFLARLGSRLPELTMGPPTSEATRLGPLVHEQHHQRVLAFLERCVQDGGRVVAGGGAPADARPGYYVEPTIVVAGEGDEIANEEVFGPVLTAMPFRDEAEAVRLANATPYDLVGAVWTAHVDRAFRVAQAVRAGTFWINCYKLLHPGSPFGGARGSGYGRSSGEAALHEYTQPKSILALVAEAG